MTRLTLTGSSFIVAAVAVLSIAGGSAGFASELPSYEVGGFPISPVQAGLLGAADVRETAAASPHQPGLLAPHRKLTATAATSAGRATR